MAWGTTGITEDELKRIAAVREYFYEQFPGSLVRDTYDTARLAQVFRIDVGEPAVTHTAVVSTEFLKDHPPDTSPILLGSWQVADKLRAAPGKEVLVMSWGVNPEPGGAV